ncbi:hypothetical protein [Bifidobacterium olomucense]|uniref:Cell surface protein n=1 Tax=Bifidobacterium olomucense TaxID=2675324 RepID=A0A7Y0EWW6_9BIFI|nr:hypothetical protein [Bifidobacterium sp. DSM 109959]NMM97543.1 hypothetical protein [Bifidobacterium sp. DSM 109959]
MITMSGLARRGGRRLIASVAVLASLAAMAVGTAGIANADATDAASITLSSIAGPSLKGRDFTAYKLGSYTDVKLTSDGNSVDSFSISPEAGVVALAAQAATDAGIDTSGMGGLDALNYVLSGSESGTITTAQLSAFSRSLAKLLVGADGAVGGDDPVKASVSTSPTSGWELTLGLTEGYYLIVENLEGGKVIADDGSFASGQPIMVGTKFVVDGAKLELSKKYKGLFLGQAVVKSNVFHLGKWAYQGRSSITGAEGLNPPLVGSAGSPDAPLNTEFTIEFTIPNRMTYGKWFISDTAANGYSAPTDKSVFTVSGDDEVNAALRSKIRLGYKAEANADHTDVVLTPDPNSWALVGDTSDSDAFTRYLYELYNDYHTEADIQYTAKKTGGNDRDGNISRNTISGGEFLLGGGYVPGAATAEIGSYDVIIRKTGVDGTPIFGTGFAVSNNFENYCASTDTHELFRDDKLCNMDYANARNGYVPQGDPVSADGKYRTELLTGDANLDGTVSPDEAKANTADIRLRLWSWDSQLGDNKFSFTETSASRGYMNPLRGKHFAITIGSNDSVEDDYGRVGRATSFSQYTDENGNKGGIGFSTDAPAWVTFEGYSEADHAYIINVKDPKNLSELAQTGGYGIIIASILAALVLTGAVITIRHGIRDAKREARALAA